MKHSSSTGTERREAQSSNDQSSSKWGRLGGALRKAILALGVLGLAWIVSRRVRSGDGLPATDEVRARAGEAVPDAVPVIGGASGVSNEGQGAQGTSDVGGGGDESEGIGRKASSVDDTMTDEEVAGRVEPDAGEEPAPPGEMNVDDDVAEEVFEDEDEAGEGDAGSTADEEEMLGQDETDTEGDEAE